MYDDHSTQLQHGATTCNVQEQNTSDSWLHTSTSSYSIRSSHFSNVPQVWATTIIHQQMYSRFGTKAKYSSCARPIPLQVIVPCLQRASTTSKPVAIPSLPNSNEFRELSFEPYICSVPTDGPFIAGQTFENFTVSSSIIWPTIHSVALYLTIRLSDRPYWHNTWRS